MEEHPGVTLSQPGAELSPSGLVLVNPDDGQGPGVGAADHVLLLPRLGVTGQEDAGRAVGQEMATKLLFVSLKSSPSDKALTSVVSPPTIPETNVQGGNVASVRRDSRQWILWVAPKG